MAEFGAQCDRTLIGGVLGGDSTGHDNSLESPNLNLSALRGARIKPSASSLIQSRQFNLKFHIIQLEKRGGGDLSSDGWNGFNYAFT